MVEGKERKHDILRAALREGEASGKADHYCVETIIQALDEDEDTFMMPLAIT